MSWPLVKIRDIVVAHYGKVLKKENRVETGKADVFGSSGKIGNHTEFLVEYPTLIVGRKGSVGEIVWAPNGGWVIDTAYFLELVDKEQLDLRFLFYALKRAVLAQRTITTSILGLNRDDFYDTKIPLPPLNEQKRIASILDKADGIRCKRQQAIKLADDFLRSVFLDMFGDPVSNPKNWKVKPLKEQILHMNNGLSRRRKTEENIGDIVLRPQDIHLDGIRFAKELNRIQLDDKEKTRYLLESGDILFVRVNGNPDYVRRSAVFKSFNTPVYHNDHIIRIKCTDDYNPEFLSYLFDLTIGRKIISGKINTSIGQHTISQGGIESLCFYRPTKSLQDKFVTVLNATNLTREKFNDFGKIAENNFNAISQKAFTSEL